MAFTNNVMIVRHKLMAELVRLWKNHQLVENVDRLPLQLTPKKAKTMGRCCIHKERAIWKYKSLPLLGLDMNDEKDELTPLSGYAKQALTRAKEGKPKENIMCVIDEACSACVQINYEVSNLCRGCIARSCVVNCPKDSVRIKKTGQATIDHETCISCGICHRSCPYHAIVYIPVPCEEACPVKAISKDKYGIEHIDESKCIYCGKCLNACPFGAIFEISQVFDVLQKIRDRKPMVAIIAPSILGQFKTTIEQVYGAFKEIGFTDVIEVAQGAMDTVSNEAHELLEKIEEGQPFMTTSCCPSYIELVEKHVKELKPYVSTTGSPMYYTARLAKEKHPDAEIVFVGPCLAKRKEAKRDEAVDYVLTFEEVGSLLDGMDIELEKSAAYNMNFSSVREAHAFAQAGGVMGAVKAFLKLDNKEVQGIQVADLNKKNIALLRAYAKSGKSPASFIEVMACEGGCITGPCTHNDISSGKRQLTQALNKQPLTYENSQSE
ncbi:MAG: monomeric [FeFe] hydrogenase [Phocaeicola sp.]